MARTTKAVPAAKGEQAGGHRAAGWVALADYCSPSMPAEHVVRAVLRRIKKRLYASDNAPVRADNRLQTTTLKALDAVVAPPAWGPLLDDFDTSVRSWLDEPDGSFHCVVVLPPCDATDVMGTWAQARGHAVLRPPARDQSQGVSVVLPEGAKLTAAEGGPGGNTSPQSADALLVIPQLESWFLRRRNGLDAVRALLAELQQSDRRCLIGCNSWAWAFLVRAVGAALVLPSPRTFAALDAQRLHAWFTELAQRTGSDRVTFRLASSGEDVLQTHSNGALASSYLKELAARSHGIAWVAWHLWRKALRTGMDASAAQKTRGRADGDDPEHVQGNTQADALTNTKNDVEGDERTFWIKGVPDPSLPHHHDDNALLVLHALLIHGALSNAELLSVLPDATAAQVLPALLRAGVIEQRQSLLSVLPAAYPAVRRMLLADGFPTGAL